MPANDAQKLASVGPPTTRQRAWLAAYLDPTGPAFLSKTEAARLAGYRCKTDAGMRRIGFDTYRRLQPVIDEWLAEAGLGEVELKCKLLELLEARKPVYFQHKGQVTECREIPDLDVQLAALGLALKVKGMFAAERIDHTIHEAFGERLKKAWDIMRAKGLCPKSLDAREAGQRSTRESLPSSGD